VKGGLDRLRGRLDKLRRGTKGGWEREWKIHTKRGWEKAENSLEKRLERG
jgi:stalled ribosome alternative rescue factor ArfA